MLTETQVSRAVNLTKMVAEELALSANDAASYRVVVFREILNQLGVNAVFDAGPQVAETSDESS